MKATMPFVWILVILLAGGDVRADDANRRLLYVAEPGIRNYVEFGGHGILVFDIDNGHKFVKRIPLAGLGDDGRPLNVKGVCANAATHRIYVSTLRHLMCVDLVTDELLWEQGDYADPSTGDVFDTKRRTLATQLTDEQGRVVQSEKMLEVDFVGDLPIREGDQFGLGRVR